MTTRTGKIQKENELRWIILHVRYENSSFDFFDVHLYFLKFCGSPGRTETVVPSRLRRSFVSLFGAHKVARLSLLSGRIKRQLWAIQSATSKHRPKGGGGGGGLLRYISDGKVELSTQKKKKNGHVRLKLNLKRKIQLYNVNKKSPFFSA